MATAYVVNLVVQYQDGFRESIALTASDVNAEFWLGQDGLSPINISGAHGNAYIADAIISPTPASTRTCAIRINGKLSPEVVLLGANLATGVGGRQFVNTPLRLPAGANLLFTQTT